MGISFSLKGDFIKKDEVFALQKEVERCHYALHEKTGRGNDFLGWVDLPVNYDKEEFDRIKKAAARIQANSEDVYKRQRVQWKRRRSWQRKSPIPSLQGSL